MRRLLAAILTVGVMAALFWVGTRQRAVRLAPAGSAGEPADPDPADGPEAAVRTLLRSAQRGDVASYRAAFAGSLHERIERELNERGVDRFADELRQASAARKSHAVFAAEPDGPNAVRIAVESVYPDRNERQTYRLEQTPDGWRVTEVDSVRTQMPKARYGSLAEYQEPEAAPVQGTGAAAGSPPALASPVANDEPR